MELVTKTLDEVRRRGAGMAAAFGKRIKRMYKYTYIYCTHRYTCSMHIWCDSVGLVFSNVLTTTGIIIIRHQF